LGDDLPPNLTSLVVHTCSDTIVLPSKKEKKKREKKRYRRYHDEKNEFDVLIRFERSHKLQGAMQKKHCPVRFGKGLDVDGVFLGVGYVRTYFGERAKKGSVEATVKKEEKGTGSPHSISI